MATDFNTKLHSILENFKDGIDKGVIDTLKTKACPEIIQLIFEQRSWKDDTYNLRDSFGWGVYYKGKQVAKGYLEAVPKATEGDRKRGLSGREQVDAFLDKVLRDPYIYPCLRIIQFTRLLHISCEAGN